MKRMRWITLVTIFLGVWGTSTLAGPNAGGALVIHTDDALVYSAGTDYKGLSERDCPNDFVNCPPDDAACVAQGIDPTSDQGEATFVWWVLAAFEETTCPRLSAVAFGVGWENQNEIGITAFGPSSDGVEIRTDGWPGYIVTGTALTWSFPRLSHLVEVYWFAGYATYDLPTTFEIRQHPNQGCIFGDDTIPAEIDDIPVSKRGTLGMRGAVGFNPLPTPTPIVDSSWGSIKHIFGTTGEE